MKRIQPYIRYTLTRAPGTATYEQCQHIWALMNGAGLEPQWVEQMPYGKAVELITALTEINRIKANEQAH